jgi:hypothetical protein
MLFIYGLVVGAVVGAGVVAVIYFRNKKKMDAIVGGLIAQIDKLRAKVNG